MIPLLIGIVGCRNTGKTTFTLECSKSLGEIGKTVSIIKFSSSHYTMDPTSKDTALFHNSDVETVIFTSPYETVTYRKIVNRSSLEDLLKLVPDSVDIVLCESYSSMFPKIPLIFVVRNNNDYEETKLRYNNQEPIFVITTPSPDKRSHIRGINTLSIVEDKKKIIDKIFLLLE
ncbi:MAG: molybdopterin-guanine dinucleotide biosynthesis protein MobB [Candidatus Heimdallarchaeota archaeon]|nr:molybdopterin-guanine dinucleotide biosynthesis protein MobB [Candidatus Heimdallarchaeota archaeon]